MSASSMVFNVLVKKNSDYKGGSDYYIAHCLELDIVATSNSIDDVVTDIYDLIKEQVDYAFCNNNLGNLYFSAPQEVWQEFYECEEQVENRIEMEKDKPYFLPPWITTRTCTSELCHV